MASRDDMRVKTSIQKINLNSIKSRLMREINGEGWTAEKVDEVEGQYRCFLWLVHKHQSEQIVPSKDIDKFWHYHILDTHKYADDCAEVFGYFLHHIPSQPGTDEDEHLEMNDAFERTKKLYAKEFGMILSEDSESNAPCCGHGSCGSNVWKPTPEDNHSSYSIN